MTITIIGVVSTGGGGGATASAGATVGVSAPPSNKEILSKQIS